MLPGREGTEEQKGVRQEKTQSYLHFRKGVVKWRAGVKFGGGQVWDREAGSEVICCCPGKTC